MAKKLRLTFKTEGNSTMEVSIADPKENLTLAQVKTETDNIIPVLAANTGLMATELKSAVYVNTEETEIV